MSEESIKNYFIIDLFFSHLKYQNEDFVDVFKGYKIINAIFIVDFYKP